MLRRPRVEDDGITKYSALALLEDARKPMMPAESERLERRERLWRNRTESEIRLEMERALDRYRARKAALQKR